MSYPAADPVQPPPSSPRNGFGITALVLGLVALLLFWTVFGGLLFGLLGVVFAVLGYLRKRKGIATNGVMALVGGALSVLALVISGVLLAVGVSFLNSEEFSNLQDCLDQAQSQSERDQCQQDFTDEVQP